MDIVVSFMLIRVCIECIDHSIDFGHIFSDIDSISTRTIMKLDGLDFDKKLYNLTVD